MHAASFGPDPPPEEIKRSELQRNYGPRLPEAGTFEATYMGRKSIPETGTLNDVLSIKQGDGLFVNKLREISNDVLSEPQVWKGFTCPKDIPGQTDYMLWVEPINSEVIPSRQYKFKVDDCTVKHSPRFSYIFSYRVSVNPPA